MNFSGREVTIKELTVAEVRAIFSDYIAQNEAMSKNGYKPDVVGETICEDVSLREIMACTNLEATQIDVLKLSALQELASAVKQANPAYLDYRRRMLNIHQQQLAQQK